MQVIKSNNLNAVYFINPDLPFEDLPDTFMIKASIFEYIPNEKLVIFAKENAREYVEIIPVIV